MFGSFDILIMGPQILNQFGSEKARFVSQTILQVVTART